jgi:D-alanyl-D-alanine carboxypeptidase/D-alanyl-D-alanine-endopeptidase (penicillin-binding protein 4)
MDAEHNLKIKGYGDPLLISEVWQEIADTLAEKLRDFEELILDDTYFSQPLIIPGCNQSTNPYDAPVGALCTNFNTVFFDRDQQGKIIPAEPQTPMIPFARQKIRTLGLKKGRYVFISDHEEAARYTGELLLYLLKQRGIKSRGGIRLGAIDPEDRLVYVYRSKFTLESAIKKMMEFSNNFVANQIFVALGASVYGPPGTVVKGVEAVSAYAKRNLHLEDIEIVEGSGISRKNHLSAQEMLTILKQFKPYRHLLNRKDGELYKTGSLKGVRARVGYRGEGEQETYYFIIFINRTNPDMDWLTKCLRRFLTARTGGVQGL